MNRRRDLWIGSLVQYVPSLPPVPLALARVLALRPQLGPMMMADSALGALENIAGGALHGLVWSTVTNMLV